MKKANIVTHIIFTILFVVNTSYADLSDGLIAYYPFSGNANDASGNSNDGTVYGATLADDRIGNPLSAYHFDGINDFIDIGNDVSLKPSLPITISAWVKLDSVNVAPIFTNNFTQNHYHGVLLAVRGGTGEYPASTSYGDGGMTEPQSRRTKRGTSVLDINSWYHVAAIIRGAGDMDIFVNGVNDGGTYSGSGGSMAYDNSSAVIGVWDTSRGAAPSYFGGFIDDLCLYNRALSAEEIVELHSSGPFPPAGNSPPVVDAGGSRTCQAGVEVILVATFVDDPSDTHTAWWDFDGDGTPDQDGIVFGGNGSGEVYGTHVYDLPGVYTAWVCVEDDKGESACDDIVITVLGNQPPVAQCQDVTVEAGGGCVADASIDNGSYDPDGDAITITQNPPGPYDLGSTEVTLIVTDESGLSDSCTATVTVVDTTPPAVMAEVTPQLVGVGQTVNFDALPDDECDATVEWDFGDGTGSTDDSVVHAYDASGIYTVVLSVTDSSDNSYTETFIVVVYDVSGGFVTGGGWIYSPAGAYTPDPSLTGKANFGFVSKYKKGASVPTGNTEFVFKADDLNFHSTSYDWLVVTGSDYARFKGWGSINGEDGYRFMLWAGDKDPDTFRIKIWWEEGEIENIVYDNGTDQGIGGGSIVIHTKK